VSSDDGRLSVDVYQVDQTNGDSFISGREVIGNQCLSELPTIRSFYDLLGKESFQSILHHLILGRTILIAAETELLFDRIIDIMKVFLFPFRGLFGTTNLTWAKTGNDSSFQCRLGALRQDNDANVTFATEIQFYRSSGRLKAQCKGSDPVKLLTLANRLSRSIETCDTSDRVLQCLIETICLEWVDIVKTMNDFMFNCPWIGNTDLLNYLHSLGGKDQDLELVRVWKSGHGHQPSEVSKS